MIDPLYDHVPGPEQCPFSVLELVRLGTAEGVLDGLAEHAGGPHQHPQRPQYLQRHFRKRRLAHGNLPGSAPPTFPSSAVAAGNTLTSLLPSSVVLHMPPLQL